MEVLLEQLYPFEQEIDQVAVEDAVVIVEIVGNIHPDDDLFEEITGELQGIQLGGFLLLGTHLKGGLDVDSAVAMIDNEIHFLLDVAAVSAIYHNTHIHTVSSADKIIVDDILHDMTGIVLPVIEPCVPKTYIGVVVFIGIVEVGFTLNVIPLCHTNQEGIDGMLDIGRY